MNPPALRVHLHERSYDIAITTGTLDRVGPFARQLVQGSSALVVTDVNAMPHAAVVRDSLAQAGFRVGLTTRQAGEGQKSLDVAGELYDALLDLPADLRTLVVAVGGGVNGGLVGFVASNYDSVLSQSILPCYQLC